jgi:putative transposase
VEPVFNVPGKRGRKHGGDVRSVVDAMLYISPTGCQGRYLPGSFGPWTRVWSQFRRWSRNGTWARALTVLRAAAREVAGRSEPTASMVVIDTHLARGAFDGGFIPRPRRPLRPRQGAKRVVAVDVTGLPVGALVVPASCHENRTTELMLDHLRRQGVIDRHELVMVDRGVAAAAARALGRHHDLELRRVGWNDSSRCSAPSGTLGASRWPTAGSDVHAGWRRRSEHRRSATGWLQVACIATTLRHLSPTRLDRPGGGAPA